MSKSNSLNQERKRPIPAVQPILERRQKKKNRVSKSLGWIVSLALHLLIMLFVAFHIAKTVVIHDDDAVVADVFEVKKPKIHIQPEREAETFKPEIQPIDTLQPSQPVKPVNIPSGPGGFAVPSGNLVIDSPDAPPDIPRIERPPIAEGKRPSIEPDVPKIAPTGFDRPSIFNEMETDIPDADIGGLDDSVNVPVVDITENTVPPKALHKPKPKYPERARNAGKEGVVKLEATIGVDGKARDIKVREGIGLGCDEAAIEALKRSRFTPAQKDGKPVAIRIIVPYRFKIED